MSKHTTIAGILDLARDELETQRAVYAKNGPADELAEVDNAMDEISDIQPLLLAAPELLEACEALCDELHKAGLKLDIKKHFSLLLADSQARKAIAKAKGE